MQELIRIGSLNINGARVQTKRAVLSEFMKLGEFLFSKLIVDMLTVQKADFGRALWVKAEVGQYIYFLQCNDNICVVMTAAWNCTDDFEINRTEK